MALTQIYASAAGSGAADGSSQSNEFSYAGMITAINVPAAAGSVFNYRGNVSRTTTVDTPTGDGTLTSPIIIRGYLTTPGDGYLGRTNGNGPLITTNMPTITYTTGAITASGSNFIIYESLNFSGAPNTILLPLGTNCAIKSCVLVNSGTGANAQCTSLNTNGVLYDCDVSLTGASGAAGAVGASAGRVVANRIKGGPSDGIRLGGTTAVIIGNVIYGCGGMGISLTSTNSVAIIISGNTIVGNTGDGIDIVTGNTQLQCITNNLITDNGGYGIDGVSAANAFFAAHNRFRDNTLGNINLATDWVAATSYGHVTTDTGGPETDYTNAGSNDYSLISASPAAGAGHFPSRDMGALQRPVVSSPVGQCCM